MNPENSSFLSKIKYILVVTFIFIFIMVIFSFFLVGATTQTVLPF